MAAGYILPVDAESLDVERCAARRSDGDERRQK